MENKPSNEKLDLFYLTFVGQVVTITTDVLVKTAQTSVDYESIPLYFEGILLDFDSEFYYLGKNPDEVTQSVRRERVIHIMVVEEKDVISDLLKQMPSPHNEEMN